MTRKLLSEFLGNFWLVPPGLPERRGGYGVSQ
jgi:hypothetical protein